ncbi:hypothetical protein [Chryseobacterium wanjuense]
MTNNDFYISYNGTSNTTLTLPLAITGNGNFKGRMYTIKNNTAFTVTINPSGSETINGNNSLSLDSYRSVQLINTGLTGTSDTWEIFGIERITASNALTIINNDIKLGGILSQPTDIATAGNNLSVSGTGKILAGINTVPIGGVNAKVIISNGEANGAVQIIDGTQGQDKVLTSDANGLATWKSPTTQNVDALLRVTGGAGQIIPLGLVTVDFSTVVFDRSSNFNLATDRFVAPTAGYYLVTCSFQTDTSTTTQGRYAYIGKNGTVYEVLGTSKVTPPDGYAISGSTIVFLNSGDYVSLLAGATTGSYPVYNTVMNIIKISN